MTPTTPTHAQSFKLGVGCRPHRGQVSEAGGKGPRRAGVPRAHPVRPGRQWRPVLALQSPRSAPGGNGEKQAARGALSMGTAQDGRDLRVSRPFFHVTHIPPAHSLQHRGSPAPRMTRWPASSTAVASGGRQGSRQLGFRSFSQAQPVRSRPTEAPTLSLARPASRTREEAAMFQPWRKGPFLGDPGRGGAPTGPLGAAPTLLGRHPRRLGGAGTPPRSSEPLRPQALAAGLDTVFQMESSGRRFSWSTEN